MVVKPHTSSFAVAVAGIRAEADGRRRDARLLAAVTEADAAWRNKMERLRAQSAARLETERKRAASTDTSSSLAATVCSLEAELLAERKRLLVCCARFPRCFLRRVERPRVSSTRAGCLD